MAAPRSRLVLFLIAGLMPAAAQAQFPYEAVVATDSGSLHVRSGPSENYYRTGLLKRGDRVTVLEETGGWVGIVPPEGSFSWISGEFVREISPTEGEVTGDKVNVRVGTPINEQLGEYVQVKLARGDKVQILGRRTSGQGPLAKLWYKIAPPEGERRYVDARFIQAADGRRITTRSKEETKPADATSDSKWAARGAARNETRTEPGAEPDKQVEAGEAEPAAEADMAEGTESPVAINVADIPPEAAFSRAESYYKTESRKRLLERDYATCRSLYEHAKKHARSEIEQAIITRRFNEIEYWESRKTAILEFERIYQRSKQRDEVFSNAAATGNSKAEETEPEGETSEEPAVDQSRYNGSGVLRKSAVTIDGKIAYVLASPQGGIRYYVTPSPGMDLQKYIDQVIAVRGPVNYRLEVRAPHIIARDITPIEVRR